MSKNSNFYQADKIAKKASGEIEAWLRSFEETVSVHNVEDIKSYQAKDIDLVWLSILEEKGPRYCVATKIEIKADTYYRTGNYFFETISNTNKNNPGCFLLTESDYLYYYFIDEKELHVIPTKQAQEWFLANKSKFRERYVDTTGKNGEVYYQTVGSLVPRKELQKHIPVDIYDLSHIA